jgi:hypothetical protein
MNDAHKQAEDAIGLLGEIVESVTPLSEAKKTKKGAKKGTIKIAPKEKAKAPTKKSAKKTSKKSKSKGAEKTVMAKAPSGLHGPARPVRRARKRSKDIIGKLGAADKAKAAAAKEKPKEAPKAKPGSKGSEPAQKKNHKVGSGGGGKAADKSAADREYQVKKQKSPLGPDHNPFKRQSHLGPAVGYTKPREVDQTDDWDCHKTGAYRQHCVNKKTGETKDVVIKVGYKQVYNHLYRKWIKGNGGASDTEVKAVKAKLAAKG